MPPAKFPGRAALPPPLDGLFSRITGTQFANFDCGPLRGRTLPGDRDGLLLVITVEEEEPADEFLGLGEWPVDARALAVAHGDAHAVGLQRFGCAQQTARLVKVPGIGKKTAERLLLELKGKLGPDLGAPAQVASDAQADIVQALVALGYSERDAAAALKALPPDIGVSEGIKAALKALA